MHRRLLAIAFFLTAAPLHATTYTVLVGPGLTFSPDVLTIRAGDKVTFRNKGGYHNVKADDNSFRCAHGCDNVGNGDGTPSNSLWFFTRTFDTPGQIGYYCETHGDATSGMRGLIVVDPTPVTLQSFEVD